MKIEFFVDEEVDRELVVKYDVVVGFGLIAWFVLMVVFCDLLVVFG